MAHAYTPGLKVTSHAVVRKRRILPIPGEVLVGQGDAVSSDTVVARTYLPGKVHPLNVVNLLSIQPAEIGDYMIKKAGETVKKGEPIAENKPFLKFMKTSVKSPIDGAIESVSAITGQVLLREPANPLEIRAYVDGRVVEVIPREGVVVETSGPFAQGIFGLGGETTGEIVLAAQTPGQEMTPDLLTPEHRGKVVVGGSYASGAIFKRAKEIGVAGIVVGGIDDSDLRDLLGYDLGVAITGTEKIGFTLILTEGFGRIAMADRTFNLLKANAGKKACISGATQIRAGVMRPEVIIPDPKAAAIRAPAGERKGLSEGDPVRVIRAPYFGRIGAVAGLNPEPIVIETEAKVRVLTVRFPDGSSAVVPRANVEILET